MYKHLSAFTPRNKQFVLIGLTLTITLQLSILGAEFFTSVWPLWFGKPITLKTRPVDPRSLFRGNYVLLNYEISRLDQSLYTDVFKKGDIAYVALQQKLDGYEASTISHRKPHNTLFIRGRIAALTPGSIRLQYGIEAYFLPKAKALDTEKNIRQGTDAVIYILENGKAALAGLKCDAGNC